MYFWGGVVAGSGYKNQQLNILILSFFQDQDLRQRNINLDSKTEEEVERIKARLLELPPSKRAVQLSAISRLLEGSGTVVDLKLPKEPIKGRGRPKGAPNKRRTTTRDPSAFEILEKKRKREDKEEENKKKKKAKVEEEAPKKKKAKFEEDAPQKKKTKKEEEAPKKKFRPIRAVRTPHQKPPPHDPEYLLLLPEILQPYISQVLDVESDGHCGFRVVSYCLGRGQHEHLAVRNKLYQHTKERGKWYKDHSYIDNISSVLNRIKFESSGPCHIGNWMSMPTCGDLIANTFKSPVFFWSTSFSQSFFPHFCPPNDNPPIFLAFISPFKHFVAVEPKNPALFPAPQVLKQWRQNAIPEAIAWEAKYTECFQLTIKLKSKAGPHKNKYY